MVVGCLGKDEQTGTVATVNGEPILYDDLKFTFDLANYGRPHDIASNPQVFREEFGAALADLIVAKLVEQELEKQGLAVDEVEFEQASDRIFAEYGTKDKAAVLREENIDKDMWERSFRRDLAFEKFLRTVIDPSITVEIAEAAQYYKDHPSEFYQPRRIRFFFLQGPREETVMEAARSMSQDEHQGTSLPKAMEHIHQEELFLPVERIPQEWITPIEQSRTQHKPIVFKADMGFQGFVFVEDISAQQLDAARAFPLSQQAVLEKKRKMAFSKWLAGTVQAADIAVSSHLLPNFSIADVVHEQSLSAFNSSDTDTEHLENVEESETSAPRASQKGP